ncbi:hypothetical protein L1I30_00085 [Gillisia sp. M10.2A]|uniref:WG repeat-containing protein n=1 Tax=Gillisia lutea TaxID=2909668 RepID=A0ABS9EF22_9FLAO|nr:hypothetical protein [Gillisia lutea]MCF4100051.1 hypothetical protein [Gillisia lutea]
MKLLKCALILFFIPSYQIEAQSICTDITSGQYFPLNIKKKKIIWNDTYYFETLIDTVEIQNKIYTEFIKEWENGNTETIFIRYEDGMVRKFEKCCEYDTTILPVEIEEGAVWLNADYKLKHEILSLAGTLKTPFCNYKNLLVVEVLTRDFKGYNYYYKKGYGYVGATKNGKLVSYLSPSN